MKSWKWKILFPLILVGLLYATKLILFDFPVSNGKRVGNLVKISKKGKFIKTWEGTIDEGSGDKLTTYFSVHSDRVAKELYDYEGKAVSLYYEEYIIGWPHDTKYNITSWSPSSETRSGQAYPSKSTQGKNTIARNSINTNLEKTPLESEANNRALSIASKVLSKTLFCSLLGSLYSDKELYNEVKAHLKKSNLYLYKQIKKCNN